jgi:uncharacterized protein YjdB
MKKILCAILVLALTSMSMGMGVYQNNLSEVNVTSYGATGNGVTDDTASIQKAIDTGASTVIIPDGTYMINALISVKPRSNQTIQMSEGTILKAIPTSEAHYQIIFIKNVSNVQIWGGTVLGERYQHTATKGEFGYGIWIADKTDTIRISNLTIKDCWGDGIMVGSDGSSTGLAKNLIIDNVVCDSNRRQGMSITYGENIIVNNCTFMNTNGTDPQAGIDIEPGCNDSVYGDYVKNVAIKNSQFINNKWAGIALIGNSGLCVDNIKITNCVFSKNYKEIHVGSGVTNSGVTDPADNTSYVSLTSSTSQAPSVSYQTHVENIGWQEAVNDGSVSGATGQSKRLEAIKITLSNLAGGIEYRTHVEDIGWMDWVSDGALSGTSGQSKRLEAIQIQLTGEAANNYDIYYRVHAQNVGWMDWAKNGESAGTAGFSYRLEAIQIVLVNKGAAAPGSTVQSFEQAL